ncbi:hypothetical protein V9T40_013171 [Parthenolecanium corni]|uniref:Unconventional myosin-XVIIIa n=1 Tax=Parthenolecanium corni TaxID=536013 RepID=A0AAN9TN20_9HEMI
MFNFIKKSGSGNGGGTIASTLMDKDEKERKKKEKKERKEKEKKEKGLAIGDDLARAEEGRKSLKLRHRRKDKEKEKLPSGITADYSANFFADLNRERLVESPNGLAAKPSSDCSVTDKCEAKGAVTCAPSTVSYAALPTQTTTAFQRALPLPPLPPRLAKKTNATNASKSAGNRRLVNAPVVEQCADESSLLSGTRCCVTRSALEQEVTDCARTASHEGIDVPRIVTSSLFAANLDKADERNEKCASVESLTDSTTNSSFVTPPFSSSPVGEGQGFYSKFADLASFNGFPDEAVAAAACEFPLPEIESSRQVAQPRQLVMSRPTCKSDFGFSLRRVVTVDRSCGVPQLQPAILAECSGSTPNSDANNERVGLLPGDLLLEVNGVSVEGCSKEDVVKMIESCDTRVNVKVQSLPELSELSRRYRDDGTSIELDESNIQYGTLKRSGSKRFKQSKGKSDRQLENEKSWLDFKRMWLIHKAGFTAVRVLSRRNDSGKVDICLESTGEQASVDEDDIEPANLPQLDKCEDLAQLRYLNESSALHTLRQRFGSNLIHTYAGPTMVIINPMVPLDIYSDQVAQMFRGCKAEDMPAHVFSLAQSAYRETITTRRDHSIVFSGRSGSGKTVNHKQVLRYLVLIASQNNKNLNTEKLNAIWTILESFGNAKTALNNNATRFTHLFSLDIDHSGQIVSASVQLFYCEKWRLVRRSESEHAFQIFYKLVAGADDILRKELAFDQIAASDQNFLFAPLQKTEEKYRAQMEFSRICSSFKLIGLSDAEMKTIFRVLAGIVHLGYASASKNSKNGKWQFSQPAAAQRAARCLGTTIEDLSHLVFTQRVPTPTNPGRASLSNISPTDPIKTSLNDNSTGVDALEGFIVGIYVELFNLVGSYVNRCISTNVPTVNSILVLDCPGFQNPASCGQLQDGASFNDLCHNYFHERLQLLFHQTNIDNPREHYAQEHIEVTLDKWDDVSPEPVVSLLDNSSTSSYLRGSQGDLIQSSSIDKHALGLLWLLDDMSTWQAISDHHIVDKIFSFYSDRENHQLIRKAPGNNHFIIQHYQGTNPVLYRADGWLKQNKENLFLKTALTFLQESKNKDIADAFTDCRGAGLTSCVAVLDCNSQSLRRVSSIRRTFATGFKRRSQALQFKFTSDGIVETLRKTRIKFAHCFLPQHDAGLIDKIASGSSVSSYVLSHSSVINVPLLRSQLRGSEILPVVRLNKQGFPTSMSLTEFRRRFSLLSRNDSLPESINDKTAAENILMDTEVDHSLYRIGFSEVFFRTGVLAQLETLRDDKLVDRIVQFQAYCRGYLSRKKVAKLKIEDVAIRCIQRNVRKFMSVRDWQWWRLLVRITPLLNVHRTEQELKSKTEELESLRSSLEKLEQERNSLRQENSKLDAKVSATNSKSRSLFSFSSAVSYSDNSTWPWSRLRSLRRTGLPICRVYLVQVELKFSGEDAA